MHCTTSLSRLARVILTPAFLLCASFAHAVHIGEAAQDGKSGGNEIVIVILGDSLTAGYGVEPGQAFPAQLERALRRKSYDVRILNAGVSGDTAADALARLDWAVPETADAVIVEIGGNDGLRGIPPERTEETLDEILTRLKKRGLPVLLTGMEAPRNFGADYTRKFSAMFPKLAEKHDVLLYPFFLQGVALERDLNQPDGIHPNAAGVAVIVEKILPSVEKLIGRIKARRERAG